MYISKMAAPTENVDDDGENESQEEESDISSSKFDPLRALYSPDINIPYPDVKIFNNVAEYESSFIKRDRQGQPQITKTQKHVGTKPSTCKQKPTSADNKPVLQMPDPSMPAVRQRMLRNVLTRMDQSFISGPLSILRRCVQEKLKAHVWTRGARSVRGVLKGYVIAFDKHFNLALVDVDEVYRIPSACRKRRKQKLEKEEKSEPVIKKESELTQKSKHQEPRRSVKDRLSLPQRSDSSKTYRGREGVSRRLSQSSGEAAKRESALPCEAAWLGMRAEDLRVRHVNQLFVRGDNVVCVNILNKES